MKEYYVCCFFLHLDGDKLIIRGGNTSEGEVVARFHDLFTPVITDYVSHDAFYMRLHASCMPGLKLHAVFSSFSYASSGKLVQYSISVYYILTFIHRIYNYLFDLTMLSIFC